MTTDDRIQAVERFGFSRRQAAFLDAVLHHSGVCLPRQYATFGGVAYGHKINRFFERLVSRGFASVCPCLHNRALVYHVHHRPLYGCHRPISEPAPPARSGGLRHASADAPRRRAGGARGDLARRSAGQGRALHDRHRNPAREPASTRFPSRRSKRPPGCFPMPCRSASKRRTERCSSTRLHARPWWTSDRFSAATTPSWLRFRRGRSGSSSLRTRGPWRLPGRRSSTARSDRLSTSLTVPDAASNGGRSATATVISLPWLPRRLGRDSGLSRGNRRGQKAPHALNPPGSLLSANSGASQRAARTSGFTINNYWPCVL